MNHSGMPEPYLSKDANLARRTKERNWLIKRLRGIAALLKTLEVSSPSVQRDIRYRIVTIKHCQHIDRTVVLARRKEEPRYDK